MLALRHIKNGTETVSRGLIPLLGYQTDKQIAQTCLRGHDVQHKPLFARNPAIFRGPTPAKATVTLGFGKQVSITPVDAVRVAGQIVDL